MSREKEIERSDKERDRELTILGELLAFREDMPKAR